MSAHARTLNRIRTLRIALLLSCLAGCSKDTVASQMSDTAIAGSPGVDSVSAEHAHAGSGGSGSHASAQLPASSRAGASAAHSGSGGNGGTAGAPTSDAAGSAGSTALQAGAAGSTSDAGSAASAGAAAASDCDRACLTELNDHFLEALIAHDATKLATADSVRFTENGKDLALTDGLFAKAKSLRDFRQDFAEVPAGQTAGFVALDDDAGAVLLAFRMRIVSRKVTEIETTVCRQGQATFFSPDSLRMRDTLYDMEVDPAERSSRDDMIAAVDSYFMALESGDGSQIPFDASASRNENGTVTASGASLSSVSQFSYIEKVERRYALVDEERGNVLPWVLFQIPMGIGGGSRTLHLAELFKVSGGKIMKIQAIMVNQPLGTPSGWD
jgi:hypothetical protein